MLFTYLFEILLLLLVFDHNVGYGKLESFFKVTQPVITVSYVKTATETREYFIMISTIFTTFLFMQLLIQALFDFEFYSILSF